MTAENTPVEGFARRRLRSDVLMMFGNKAALLVLGIAGTIITARYLGPFGRGNVAVAFNMTLLLVQIGTFGIVSANPYFIAKDSDSIGRAVGNSLWIAGAVGLVLIGAGVVVKIVLPSAVAGLSWTELMIALAGIPFALAAAFLQSILLGEDRPVAYNLIDLFHGLLVVALLLIGYIAFDMGVQGTITLTTVAYALGALAFLVALARHSPIRRPDVTLARRMVKYAFRVYVATLLSFLVIRLDLILVNAYLGSGEAGIYSVAAALAQGMYIFPSVVGLNLFARVARGAPDDMTAQVFRSVALLYGVVCVITIPLAAPAIRILYGSEFQSAATLYYWLVPGIFSLGMLTLLSNHFAGRGFPLEAMLVWFVGLGVNIAINVAFLESRGTYIASLASSVAYTLLLALHVRLFARDEGGYSSVIPRPGETIRFVRTALAMRAPR